MLKRSEQLRVPVEQHRTPTGCVLQAPTTAVSVSWFSGAGNDPVLGELRVVVWRGVVSRRGSPKQKEGAGGQRDRASPDRESIRRPGVEDDQWRRYDTPGLALLCTKLLDQQVRSTDVERVMSEGDLFPDFSCRPTTAASSREILSRERRRYFLLSERRYLGVHQGSVRVPRMRFPNSERSMQPCLA